MILHWKVRYIDTRTGDTGDRDLILNTATLPWPKRAAVEALRELRETDGDHLMLKARSLFRELKPDEDLGEMIRHCGSYDGFIVLGYFEDQDGKTLVCEAPPSTDEAATTNTLAIDRIELSSDQIRLLGYFARDLEELSVSTFIREGQGQLSESIETAYTLEELRSFLIVFRRLYMASEPANLKRAAELFCNILTPHPITTFVGDCYTEYVNELRKVPWVPKPFAPTVTFRAKRVIDVFLYTQFIHQPCKKRLKQYAKCLKEVGGREHVLLWLFLSSLSSCAYHMLNAGGPIVSFFRAYCETLQLSDSLVSSMTQQHPGIGAKETRDAKRDRIMREKAEEIALARRKSERSPQGGSVQFLAEARRQLEEMVRIGFS